MRWALVIGLCLTGCGGEALEVFLPLPEPPTNAKSLLLFFDGPGFRGQFARRADDDSPLLRTLDLTGEDRIDAEALFFELTLEELGLEPGPLPPSPISGARLESFDPQTLKTQVRRSGAEIWRRGPPSEEAAAYRAQGPCPSFELEEVGMVKKLVPLRWDDSKTYLVGPSQLWTVELSESGEVETSSRAWPLSTSVNGVARSGDDGIWTGTTTIARVSLETFEIDDSFLIPPTPEIPGFLSSMIELDASSLLLVTSDGRTALRRAGSAGIEVLNSHPIRGRAIRNSFMARTPDERILISLFGAQSLFTYAEDMFSTIPFLEAGVTGIGPLTISPTFGPMLVSADSGLIFREYAPRDWRPMEDVYVDFEPSAVHALADGVLIAGQTGELGFISDRTGFCSAQLLRYNIGARIASVGEDHFVLFGRTETGNGDSFEQFWVGRLE